MPPEPPVINATFPSGSNRSAMVALGSLSDWRACGNPADSLADKVGMGKSGAAGDGFGAL